MRYPKRKAVVKEKRKQERERNNDTYVNIAKSITQNNTYRPPTTTHEDMLRINTCVLHAHYRNVENPGSYEAELSKILKLNNLATIKIPENPNSNKVLNIPMTRPTPATRKERTVHSTETHTNETEDEREEDIADSLQEPGTELTPICEARDVGLQVYVSEDMGWPKTQFSVKDLVNGINNNKFKWTYNKSTISRENACNDMRTKS